MKFTSSSLIVNVLLTGEYDGFTYVVTIGQLPFVSSILLLKYFYSHTFVGHSNYSLRDL